LETDALPIELHPYLLKETNPRPRIILVGLFGFAVDHMPSQQWIVLLQLKAALVITAVLARNVHVSALGASQLNDDTIAFFRHELPFLLYYTMRRRVDATCCY
jgi:hypothetical protein